MTNIKNKLLDTLDDIQANLNSANSDEEYAILLNAKANVLIALQKYEEETK